MRNYLTEAIGTFFLVLAVCFTGNPLAIGLMLAVMVYIGGHISGGHYNPAVSLAVFFRKGLSSQSLVGYWASQIIGAFLAAMVFYIISHKTFVPMPGVGYSFQSALILELLCTFALALVVLTVATASKLKGNYVYGFAIGLTVTSAAFIAGPISGGAFNPAVALGPIILDAMLGGSGLANLLLYILGPLAGGALAAFVFGYINNE